MTHSWIWDFKDECDAWGAGWREETESSRKEPLLSKHGKLQLGVGWWLQKAWEGFYFTSYFETTLQNKMR